jgi:hypothetical protein
MAPAAASSSATPAYVGALIGGAWLVLRREAHRGS